MKKNYNRQQSYKNNNKRYQYQQLLPQSFSQVQYTITNHNIQQQLKYSLRQILLLWLANLLPPYQKSLQFKVKNSQQFYLIGQKSQCNQYLKKLNQYLKEYAFRKIKLSKNIFLEQIEYSLPKLWKATIYRSSTIRWATINLINKYQLLEIKPITQQFFIKPDQPQIILLCGANKYITDITKQIDRIIQKSSDQQSQYRKMQQILKPEKSYKKSVKYVQKRKPNGQNQRGPIKNSQKTQNNAKDNKIEHYRILDEIQINDNKEVDLDIKAEQKNNQANFRLRENPNLENNLLAVKQLYNEAISLNCPSEQIKSKLYCNRSFVYAKLGLYEQSLADCQKSLIYNPNCIKAQYRKIKVLISLNRFQQAKKILINKQQPYYKILNEQILLLENNKVKKQQNISINKKQPIFIKCPYQFNIDASKQFNISQFYYNFNQKDTTSFIKTEQDDQIDNTNFFSLIFFNWTAANPWCTIVGVFQQQQKAITQLQSFKNQKKQFLLNLNKMFYAQYLNYKQTNTQNLQFQIYVIIPCLTVQKDLLKDTKNIAIQLSTIFPKVVSTIYGVHLGSSIQKQIRQSTIAKLSIAANLEESQPVYKVKSDYNCEGHCKVTVKINRIYEIKRQ